MQAFSRHLLANLEQLGFHEKLDFLAPDKTEVRGKMVRNFMGPGSPIFCLTEELVKSLCHFQDLR